MEKNVELTLIRKDEIEDKEVKAIKDSRKKMREAVIIRNYNEGYPTLIANGLVPNGIKTKDKIQECEQTAKKQYEVEKFVLTFNELKKSERKEYTVPCILGKLNGTEYSTIYEEGINIHTISSITLHSIKEILEALDVVIADNRIVENKNIKLLYYPIMDEKYKIVDVDICIFVTNDGIYNLNYKWE